MAIDPPVTTPQKAAGIAYSDRGITPLASTYGAPVTVSVLANALRLKNWKPA